MAESPEDHLCLYSVRHDDKTSYFVSTPMGLIRMSLEEVIPNRHALESMISSGEITIKDLGSIRIEQGSLNQIIRDYQPYQDIENNELIEVLPPTRLYEYDEYTRYSCWFRDEEDYDAIAPENQIDRYDQQDLDLTKSKVE